MGGMPGSTEYAMVVLWDTSSTSRHSSFVSWSPAKRGLKVSCTEVTAGPSMPSRCESQAARRSLFSCRLGLRLSCGKWQNVQFAPFWQRPLGKKLQRLHVPAACSAEPVEGNGPKLCAGDGPGTRGAAACDPIGLVPTSFSAPLPSSLPLLSLPSVSPSPASSPSSLVSSLISSTERSWAASASWVASRFSQPAKPALAAALLSLPTANGDGVGLSFHSSAFMASLLLFKMFVMFVSSPRGILRDSGPAPAAPVAGSRTAAGTNSGALAESTPVADRVATVDAPVECKPKGKG
mmetsp:Transcript_125721/g.350248  ORF Transcript_125721/g.350248 Transcript_125721/m.350248 type:complete len:293 (+) Transcript_125721:662-1540(+)